MIRIWVQIDNLKFLRKSTVISLFVQAIATVLTQLSNRYGVQYITQAVISKGSKRPTFLYLGYDGYVTGVSSVQIMMMEIIMTDEKYEYKNNSTFEPPMC